jgi:hypothetical protein
VRTVETKTDATIENTPEIYAKFDKYSGFVCLNNQQLDGQCLDYEISLCCPPGPENGTVMTLECNIPDWYLDYTDVPFLPKLTATCTDNRY